MGTIIVGAILLLVVALVIRSMVRDKKMESHCSAEEIAVIVEDVATNEPGEKK